MPTVLAQSNLPKSAAVVVSSETIVLRDPNNSILEKYSSDEQKQLSLKSYGIKPTSLLSPGENKTTPIPSNIIFYRWLQNVGEAYINSLIQPKSTYKYEFAVNHVSDAVAYVFGAYVQSGSGSSSYKAIRSNIQKGSDPSFNLRIYMTEEGNDYTNVSNISNNFEKITLEGGKVFVNDVEAATISTFNPNTTLDIDLFLFAYNLNNNRIFRGSIRLAYFKIYDETANLLRDFVPASRNGEFGLYDKITHTLFVNANENGSFVGGNDETVIPNSGPLGFGNIDASDVIDNNGETM